MDFNFNPEDEAFRMEFRSWLNANKQFAPHMGETTIGMAEGRGEFDQQKHWPRDVGSRRVGPRNTVDAARESCRISFMARSSLARASRRR